MNKDGLAAAPAGTTEAPKEMYVEVEQDENVAKGCVQVKELIAYDFVEKKKVIEKDKIGNVIGEKEVIIEKSRNKCFCQSPEDAVIYKANNPDARIETFSIQLLKSTAKKYINDPENMKQFKEKDNG